MIQIKIRQVDAFTSTPHTGNPAGVVINADGLSDKQMQSIAREMNLSETAFLLSPTRSDADIRIRWFTPQTEVNLCGHATVASFHVLAEDALLGMNRKGSYHFSLESASGIFPIDVTKDDHGSTIMMGLKIPTFERVMHYKIDLVRVLNISLSEFDNRIPIIRSDDLYVPVKRLHTLFTMKPNFITMTNFLNARRLQGVCVFTMETVERNSTVHSRFFAPSVGINEDPVTGSAHGPLAVHLFENGLLEMRDGLCSFQGEQGDAIGRRGRVRVDLATENNKPVSVKIGGTAVTVLDGSMLIQE